MSTSGQQAEDKAAEFLAGLDYEIIERNWRTRWCEVDIVARKHQTIYLVEVKYRQNTAGGGGLDYVHQSKLQRLRLAAEIWQSQHDWDGPIELAAVELSGADFKITNFLESLT